MVLTKTLSTTTIGAACAVLGTIGSAEAAQFFNTSDNPQLSASTDNQGWWSNTIKNNDANNAYLVGETSTGARVRNFFTFNISSRDEVIGSAELQLRLYGRQGVPSLALFDVTTSASSLNRNIGPDRTSNGIFFDLGAGDRYGGITVGGGASSNILTISLNQNAIADINNAIRNNSNFFSIGGSITNVNNPGRQALFVGSESSGGATSVQRLSLTPVPEPSSVMGVLGFGAFGVGWMLKRRQKNRKAAM